ncbi:Protein of unknown function [Duganella sp. CF402]|uniref:YagK/YfjJ domain-containing protein n=1 Tax=unclassified Duganella TaxID=2636909 RepID=UPI0008D38195|nr:MULTISPECIES: inovirus-type Gp2 protein [unclassified Duganella]RZT04567.1 uncharacterized protein DUF3296 [Duganella sp. BK701]SEM31877.1 Protein of unknown function [Duganella sp. CF402]
MDAINFHSQPHITLEDGRCLIINEKNYAGSYWYSIYQFVRSIEKAAAYQIESIINANDENDLQENAITQSYQTITGLIRSHDPDCIYGPHIQLFYDVALEVNGDKPVTFEKFKELVGKIRFETKNKSFKKKSNRKRERQNANEKTVLEYVDSIFQNHSRPVIIRLDLHLKLTSIERLKQHAKIREKFTKFLNDRRSNKFFERELGYVWKFEDGESLGGHYHLIIILDGAYVQKDEFIASQIGEYWKKITDGEGTYFNANSKKYLDNLIAHGVGIGVGRIESHDTEKRGNLTRIVKYFFKLEQYVEAKLSAGARSFGKGIIKKNKGGGGRPRKSEN